MNTGEFVPDYTASNTEQD